MRDTLPVWRLSLRAVLLATATLAVLLPTMAAYAADGDDDEDFDNKIFRNVLEGLGLRSSDKGINYRERSPLVVPPNLTALPAPEAAAANAPANWPVDQDVKRAKAEKAAKRSARYLQNDSVMEDGRPLRPDEMARSGRSRGTRDESQITTKEESERPSKPSALGYVGNIFSDAFKSGGEQDVAVFRGEPARESLTEPPVGYQTPSPTQPYGLTGIQNLPKAEGKNLELQR
ncbi:MAG: hypothetical protein J0H78_18040 [Rhizobiales bacterium]|nr:hypothetical protein [Hyphomicrobiales bacterium]OJY44952.1 MAG: hypothetical protein BGP08_00495 [Rhizobiales bacterium 64-17]